MNKSRWNGDSMGIQEIEWRLTHGYTGIDHLDYRMS